MAKNLPRIGIDFTSLDHLSIGNGQYRYLVDLLIGLDAITEADFIIFGSKPEAVPEIRHLLSKESKSRWRYHQVSTYRGRVGIYAAHLQLSWLAMRYRLDLWHAAHTFSPLFCPCPLVVTEHDLMWNVFDEYKAAAQSGHYRLHRWMVQHRATHVICISECTQNDLLRLFPMPAEKTSVVYHGTSFLKPSVKPAVPVTLRNLRAPWIASPYNLEPRKNLHGLLRAFAELLAEFPSLRLVLFGRAGVTGQREREFEDLLNELGIAGSVERTGYVADNELMWIYRNCTIFAFPSLYEGFGLPILEAMAQGACVIGRGASAMAEVISDAGMLVETAKPTELAAALASLLRDPDLRQELGQRAVQTASSFTVDRMARKTLEVYLSAIGYPTSLRSSDDSEGSPMTGSHVLKSE